ncbi:hypothetical protein BGW37DRAFT_464229 [Umbelopsis sp. PMI_123]|nr:hypothetical protein BGW37DRAFT_464229 [Umbelopsis sp. PMI_123]
MDAIRNVYDRVQESREKDNDYSNVLRFLRVAIEKCNDPQIRDKITNLKNEFVNGKVNQWFVVNRIGMLIGNPTGNTTNNNNITNNYDASSYQYIVNVLKENQAQDFLSNNPSNYMFFDDDDKVHNYIHCCIGQEVDPVIHSRNHLDRSEIKNYTDDEVYDTIEKMVKCVASSDRKAEDFKDVSQYIEQLKGQEYIIGLFGEVNSGKSTIINTIIGEEIAQTLVDTCTALPIIYENDRNRDIPILILGDYFVKQGYRPTYQGKEIMSKLIEINDLARKKQCELKYDQWPVIRVHFHGIGIRFRIIDTPGISEQSSVLTNFTKEALQHSVSAMIVFQCNRINTEIELKINENLRKDKHLYLLQTDGMNISTTLKAMKRIFSSPRSFLNLVWRRDTTKSLSPLETVDLAVGSTMYDYHFENKKNPIRESVIKEIFSANEELERNIYKRQDFKRVITAQKQIIKADELNLQWIIGGIDKAETYLHEKYDSIKNIVPTISKAEKRQIVGDYQDAIIFLIVDKTKVTKDDRRGDISTFNNLYFGSRGYS